MTRTIQPTPVPPAPDPDPADTAPYLWTRLQIVEERVRQAVALRRAVDPDPDDPYRGQYLAPAAAARILDAPHDAALPPLGPAGPRPARRSRSSPRASRWRRSTWTCSWSPWRRTWTPASNGSTATSTTT